MDGSIESWNPSGFGVIRGLDGKTYLAHFSGFVEYKNSGKKIFMEVGQDVSFIPTENRADDIEYDSRSPLFRFAFFRNYEATIADLAVNHALPEKWSSSSFNESELLRETHQKAEAQRWFDSEHDRQIKKTGFADDFKIKKKIENKITGVIAKRKYEVLFSFFERTFERLKLENKIVYSESGATFNTALGNKFNKDIYAVFKKNESGSNGFVFEKFADENQVGKWFPQIPEPPNYFLDINTGERTPSDHLFLDLEKKIFADDVHLFDERRSRFPDSWAGLDDEECVSNFEKLLHRTQRRVRRNFRAAVPFYYPALRKIQLLLPVTFDPGSAQEETSALVISRVGAGYSVETIMPLPWAYKNARLLAKPDREDWLDF